MNRGTLKTLAALALLAGCATTNNGGRVVDAKRNEVVIASSGDERSLIAAGKTSSDTQKVESKLETSVSKDSRDVPAMINLAQIYIVDGRYDEAEELGKKVLRIDMKNLEARKVLAQAAVRKGQYELAELYLASFGGANSKDPQVINLLALIELGRGNNTAAARLFRDALKNSPNDIAVRMNLGVLYLKHRQLAQASVEFERVLRVDPENLDAKLHMGIVMSIRGQTDEAIKTFNGILSGDKKNQLALFNLAVVEKKKGNYDDALEHLKLFVKYATSKSAQTDQAFALMEEINQARAEKGEKVTDKELQALADDLDTKKPSASENRKQPKRQAVAEQPAKAKPAADDVKENDVEKETEKNNLEQMIGH